MMMMTKSGYALQALTPLLLFSVVLARVPPNGACETLVFAPFTRDGEKPEWGLYGYNITLGFSNMAAALLAVQHFNERNTSIIPELEQFKDCNVQLSIRNVFDTGGYSSLESAESLWRYVFEQSNLSDINRPFPWNEPSTPAAHEFCAIVGPNNDIPLIQLGAFASGAQVPLVASFQQEIQRDSKQQMISSVHPDIVDTSEILVSYLDFLGRDDIVVLYPFNNPGLQRQSTITNLLDSLNKNWKAVEYLDEDDHNFYESNIEQETRLTFNIAAAMERVRQLGYRTVIVDVEDDESNLQAIADAAVQWGMTGGEFMFVFAKPLNSRFFAKSEARETVNSNITRFLHGSSFPFPFTFDLLADSYDIPQTKSWGEQGPRFVSEVNRLNPIQSGETGYIHADNGFFQRQLPESYAAFIYDAMMTVGFGACDAPKQADGSVQGIDHKDAIRNSTFMGWSGFVRFGKTSAGRGGTRPAQTLAWGSINILSFLPSGYHIPEIANANLSLEDSDVPFYQISWSLLGNEHIYADNSTSPPYPFRTPGEQNYLPSQQRAVGLSLMGLIIVCALAIMLWVVLCRKHRVLMASQPPLLYVICFGAILQCATVITFSFDEGAGLSASQLSKLCQSLPWLFAMGIFISSAALYVKLLRIHVTLQFSREKVKLLRITAPMLVLGLSYGIILSCQSALAPLAWVRDFIGDTNESHGTCRSPGVDPMTWILPLGFVFLCTLCLLVIAVYKTRDIDEIYSDSFWIFLMLFVHLELFLISIPIIIQLHGEDPTTVYIVFKLISLSFPSASLGFIFGPKVKHYVDDVRGVDPNRRKRGQRIQGTRVTGLLEEDGGETKVKNGANQEPQSAEAVKGDQEVTENERGNVIQQC